MSSVGHPDYMLPAIELGETVEEQEVDPRAEARQERVNYLLDQINEYTSLDTWDGVMDALWIYNNASWDTVPFLEGEDLFNPATNTANINFRFNGCLVEILINRLDFEGFDFKKVKYIKYNSASISNKEVFIPNVDLLEFTARKINIAPSQCRAILGKEIHFNGDSNVEQKAFRKAKTEKLLFKGKTEISYEAFESCPNLKKVLFKGSAEIFEAFSHCPQLEKVVFKKLAIVKNAFTNCEHLKIVIFEGPCMIKKYAFSGCKELHTVILRGGGGFIDDGAFSRCTALRKVVLPRGAPFPRNIFTEDQIVYEPLETTHLALRL